MLRPHLKPSNQRHLPYSSAYSASKRALAPVPPLPTLTATIPPPIPPHRLEVLTRPRAGDFIAAASSSSSLSRAACRVSPRPDPAPYPIPRMNRPQSWLISSSISISSISIFVTEELVVIPARRLHRRGTDSSSAHCFSFSPSQRSSQTPSCSLRVFLPNLHYP